MALGSHMSTTAVIAVISCTVFFILAAVLVILWSRSETFKKRRVVNTLLLPKIFLYHGNPIFNSILPALYYVCINVLTAVCTDSINQSWDRDMGEEEEEIQTCQHLAYIVKIMVIIYTAQGSI